MKLFLVFAGLSLALPQAVLERSPLDRLALQFPQEFAAAMQEPHLAATWLLMAQTHSAAELERRIAQYTATRPVKTQHYNNRQFAAFASDFDTVQSARFDNHALRIKKSDPRTLGLDTVNQYTGYLDVNDVDKHFFYWFFESRNDPQTDPVILWLNGGPGCLSATGLLFELGPSSINLDMQPVYNPHSWNSNASVIFLDQPVGVGYLYTGGDAVTNTAAAARDVYVFLELFFQKFPHFAANKFHIAGELYAGHYIPSFASEIINQADRLFELASVLIGNGITDPLVQYGSYGPMACGKGGYPQVISDEQCAQLDRQYPQCAALTKLCYDLPGVFTCVPATVYCESMMEPYTSTGLNPYDIRMKCEDSGGNCYKEMDVIDNYLNTEFVKNAVGANVEIFKLCDDTVFRNFLFQGDETLPFQQYVAELLEKNVPVLLYAGDKDYICNWLGNHAWSDALEYSGHAQFARAKLQPWLLHGRCAGEVKNEGIFTFLRIYDAGHMVPYDQPEHALDMVNRWIGGDYAMAK